MFAAFTSGVVLLLNIWGAKKSGMPSDPTKQMSDVHKCMLHLKDLEPRFRSAGRLWDILYELASAGELPLPHPSPPGQVTKRHRDSDHPIGTSPSSSTQSDAPAKGSRPVHPLPRRGVTAQPGQLSAQHPQHRPSQTPTPPQTSIMGTHPKTSATLGALPINPGHPQNAMGIPTNQAGMPLDWNSYISPHTPAGPNANYGPQMGTESFVQQQMYGMYSANPGGTTPVGYPDSYGPPPQQDTTMGHPPHPGNYQGGGTEGYLTDIWQGAPSGFE